MRVLIAAGLLVVPLVAVYASAQTVSKPSDQFLVSMELATAIRARDGARISSLMVPNAVVMPPGGALFGGGIEFESMIKRLSQAPPFQLAIVSVGSSNSGQLGYDSGTYELTIGAPGPARRKERGKYVALLRQGDDGKWQVTTLIWNLNGDSESPMSAR